MTLSRYLTQVFKPPTAKQLRPQVSLRRRYASAMTSYTPSHRARHQELAWHAAKTSFTEAEADPVEAEDVLEGIAGSSATSVHTANTRTNVNRSGSAAAANLPFTNGEPQRREFSTTSFWLRSAKQVSSFRRKSAGRVGSTETMHTDTTFASSSPSTHTTAGSEASSTSLSPASAREYSSKPEKFPEQKKLDDEEKRLAEKRKLDQLFGQVPKVSFVYKSDRGARMEDVVAPLGGDVAAAGTTHVSASQASDKSKAKVSGSAREFSSLAKGCIREYSSKPEKTAEQKRLDDEEHRLAEGLVKGDDLMNSDEGMNPNEDKEGMRIHPAATHHHNNRGAASKSKRTGKNDGGGMPTGGPVNPTAKAGQSYSTSTKVRGDKNGAGTAKDETMEDRLLDRNALNPESYEYTRSGTDGEVGDDAEAYCREHVRPEDELREEQRLRKGHNPLEFSPANRAISKPPLQSGGNEPAYDVHVKKSKAGKSRKGHAVGTKFGEEKIRGELGL